MSFYVKIGSAVLGIVGLAIIAILILGSEDRTGLEAVIDDMLDGARRYDAERVVAHLSRDCTAGSETYASIVSRLRRYCTQEHYSGIDVEDRSVSVAGDSAMVDASILLKGSDILIPPRFRLRLILRREAGWWWVTSIESRPGR